MPLELSFITQREKCMYCSVYLCCWTVTSGSGEHVTTWASTATSASGLWTEALCYSVSSSACTNKKKQFHEQWDYSVLIQVFLIFVGCEIKPVLCYLSNLVGRFPPFCKCCILGDKECLMPGQSWKNWGKCSESSFLLRKWYNHVYK